VKMGSPLVSLYPPQGDNNNITMGLIGEPTDWIGKPARNTYKKNRKKPLPLGKSILPFIQSRR
jgi:hypothetical protein